MGVTSSRSVRTGTSTLFAWLFVFGIVVSLLIHFCLYLKARGITMPGFSAESYDMIVPRTFRMKRVEIDPQTLETPRPSPSPRPPERLPSLPEERPQAQGKQTHVSGQKEDKIPMPQVLPETLTETMPFVSDSRGSGMDLFPDPGTTAGRERSLPEDRSDIKPTDFPVPSDLSGMGEKTTGIPGFSSLDDLLEGAKPLTAETPPILMPTDLLFGYDSEALRPEAAESLSKLGTIIRNASGAKFRIEGHTDSFGSDAYNDALSLRRAEAVKAWLVTTMGIPSGMITTAGLGKMHPLAPVTGSIAEQQLNRRVEIVITKD